MNGEQSQLDAGEVIQSALGELRMLSQRAKQEGNDQEEQSTILGFISEVAAGRMNPGIAVERARNIVESKNQP